MSRLREDKQHTMSRLREDKQHTMSRLREDKQHTMSRLREDKRQRSRLTPRARLTRGLTYTAVGPLDISRGAVGLGLQGAHSAGSGLRRRYDRARIAGQVRATQETVARELAAASEVVAGLPQAFQEARRPNRRRRRLIIFSAAGVLALAGGAVAFSIIRRSSPPEPSARPPSVEVTPKP
jgi:hypothetical protein